MDNEVTKLVNQSKTNGESFYGDDLGGPLPVLLPEGEMSLEELTEALSTTPKEEVRGKLLVVAGKGVFELVEGKYRLLSVADAEWRGAAKLSEPTRRRLRRTEPSVKAKVKKRRKRRRVPERTKKLKAQRWQRESPLRCEYESKRYRRKMADPYKSWVLYGELKKGYWDITLDEWLDYVWPVYSKEFVWIRRWETSKPFSLGNLFLQLRSEHPSKYLTRLQRSRPTGVVLDTREIVLGLEEVVMED